MTGGEKRVNAMAQGRYEEGGREGGSEVRGGRGSAFRDADGACLAFIDHREISEDISSYQGRVRLSSSQKVRSNEEAGPREIQVGDVDLRDVYVDRLRAVYSRHGSSVDDR